MISLSPKLKVLISVAVVAIVGIIAAVVAVVVIQKNNVAKIKSIAFTEANIELAVGDEKTLNVSISPEKAVDKRVSFWSGDSSVVQVISQNGGKAVVRAIGIGETTLYVKSLANGKLTDSCHVVVGDVVAQSIECGAQSVVVGHDVSIDIVLEPSNSNPNKLKVVSFDADHLDYSRIEVSDGVAKLVCNAKNVGTSQIVVGFTAQTENGEKIVLTQSVVVSSVAQEVEEFDFEACSSSVDVFDKRNDFYIVPNRSDYILKFRFLGDGTSVDVADVVVDCDSSVVELAQKTDSIEMSFASTNWKTTAVRFSYAGHNRIITLHKVKVNANLSDFSCEIDASEENSVYKLTEGKCYKIGGLSENFQKLIDLGVVELYLSVESQEYVSLDAQSALLVALKKTEQQQISISVKNLGYWDLSVIARDAAWQINLKIKITGIQFEEAN